MSVGEEWSVKIEGMRGWVDMFGFVFSLIYIYRLDGRSWIGRMGTDGTGWEVGYFAGKMDGWMFGTERPGVFSLYPFLVFCCFFPGSFDILNQTSVPFSHLT